MQEEVAGRDACGVDCWEIQHEHAVHETTGRPFHGRSAFESAVDADIQKVSLFK
jgi:hypothetical protein